LGASALAESTKMRHLLIVQPLSTSTGLIPHNLSTLIDTGADRSLRIPQNESMQPVTRQPRKPGTENDRLVS